MVTIAAAARRCGLLDLNLARRRRRDLRQRDREHAIGEVSRDLLDVDLVGELEGARERAVAADPEAADPTDWGAALTSYLLDTYRVGWPFRSLEMRWWYSGDWSEATPETVSASDGLPAPRAIVVRGLFERSDGRIPTRPIPAGFAINTLFYAALLALPLSVFPIRRRLRARRGRCPKCGYDRAGLAGAEKGAEGAAPCPECGATQ
jgi:hypothetical protein